MLIFTYFQGLSWRSLRSNSSSWFVATSPLYRESLTISLPKVPSPFLAFSVISAMPSRAESAFLIVEAKSAAASESLTSEKLLMMFAMRYAC